MLDSLLFFSDAILATILGAAACALVGFFLTNMSLPFLGVCLSHAALAGAVTAQLLGLPLAPSAFIASIGAAFLVGPIADIGGSDVNVALGILFSMLMGVAFLMIGMLPGPRSEALGLIWGSVLFVRRIDLILMGLSLAGIILFVLIFYKELRAALFSRTVAATAGIRSTMVFYLLLLAAGAVVAVNLDTVGGLMLYALLVTPSAAANTICRSYTASMLATVIIGVTGSLGGLYLSYALNAPTGASLVIVLGVIFAICVLIKHCFARLVWTKNRT